MGVTNAWGEVVGVAGSNPHNYTVKINVQRTYPDYGKDWFQQNMPQAPKGMTFEGKKLYIIGYGNTNMDGVEQMQFQYYDGNNKQEEVKAIEQWQTSVNGAHPYGYIYNYDEKKWYENGNFVSGFNFYFDATGWEQTTLHRCIGHAYWHTYDHLTKIPNTNLYYCTREGWGGASGLCVVGNTSEANHTQGDLLSISQNATEFSGFRNYILKSAGNTAYLMVNKGNAGQMPDMHYYDNFDKLNYTQTIKTAVKHATNDYTIENNVATISIKSYKITGNGVATEQSASITSTSNTATISAARTATTTLTVDWGSLDPNYKFEGWYDENGNRLATEFAYTYNPTTENTIYARFKEAPSRTVYFKPNNVWKKPGDRFVAKWKGGEYDVAEEIQMVSCSEYYKHEIPGRFADDYQTITFHKVKATADNVFDDMSEIDKDAGETANLEIPAADDPDKLYDMTKIYLKPNDTWKSDGARFAAYFWVSDSDPVQEKWMSMSPSPENDGTYYCDYPTDHAYDYVIFSRMNPANTDNNFDNRWNSTINLSLHNNNKKGYGNLFQINSIDNGEWQNKWTTYTATTTVTLVADSHGTYKVTCSNGTSLTSALNENRTLSVPLNSTITIETVQPQPGYAHTHGARIQIGTNEETTATLGTEYTICGETTIKGNFVTANPTKIYLKPNIWNTNNPTYVAHVWHDGGVKDYTMTGIGDAPYAYYSCTIDPGYHSIVFYRKSTNGQTIWNKTKDLFIPVDDNILYSITSMGEGEFNPAEGNWGPLPTCHIKAGYTDVGRYGIKDHNGKIHYAVDGISAEFDVPFGSQVEVLEGEPGNSAYTGTIGLRSLDNSTIRQKFHDGINNNNFVTIVKDTMFDDLFGLKARQIVYLGIPDAILPYWEECSNPNHTETNHNANVRPYIWHHTPYGPSDMLVDEPEIFKYNHTTFYKYTLPVGISSFDFQSKEGDNSNPAHAEAKRQYYPPIPYKNCFMLDGKKDGNQYTGRWIPLPLAEVGDYRVLYAEKELIKTHEEGETEDWETAFRTVYEHPSDIIKQTLGTASKNTVSLHITTTQERDGKTVHPMVILQQFQRIEGNTYDWVNLQAHTVLRLKATGNMGMLPGRKKAFGDLPFYDDGIEVIKNDTQYEDCTDDKGNSYKGSGVWNFVVNQASDGSVELDLSQTKRYQGEYYIRTNNAPGIWDQYTDNEITYSSYAEQYSGFSHYYCKWVDLSKHSEDVSFVIANDHATNLTDPSKLFEDQYITDEKLTENANVRWGWEHMTNKVSRAYIRGTWDTNEPPARIENIVVDYTPSEVDAPEQKLLYDSGDWIYSINLEDMKVGSKLNTLTAKYPSNGYTQTFAENINMLVGDYDNTKSYIVRILYDFKIDKTLVALVPNKNEATVGIDVLIERIDQGPATQVVAQVNSKKNNNEGSTVYGAFTFTQPHLTDTKLSEQEKLTYWFSFPFDVLLSDVYGFGEVGKYWMIKEYDGKSRAKEGLTEDNTFWKFITKKSTVLQANKGYVLTLNKRLMNEDDVVYTNTDSICLYFPSQNLVTSIDNGFTVEEDQVIEIPQWTGETAKKEWNWNLIGIPSYANKEETITADHLYYFFDYRHSNDTYEVMYLGDHTFKSTFAYMVQFAGDINWHTFKTTPKQLAAQKDASAEINHVMRLELLRNNQREDKTYIQLTENENATEQFDMNFDLTKMANAKANLYSLIGNHQLAANVLPLQTTVVPLGVIIKTAGEYTFSMPEGTDGIVVELIDYETNTRTNLLLDNYTVTLPAGTNNSRFALSLQPDKTVTSVDNIGNEATGDKVKKYLIDGVLYMQKDGVLYDAQGRKL